MRMMARTARQHDPRLRRPHRLDHRRRPRDVAPDERLSRCGDRRPDLGAILTELPEAVAARSPFEDEAAMTEAVRRETLRMLHASTLHKLPAMAEHDTTRRRSSRRDRRRNDGSRLRADTSKPQGADRQRRARTRSKGAPPAMAVARLDTIERQCRGCAARRRSRATGRRAGRRLMVLHPLDMQIWLKRTGRWFRSEAEERRWREMVGRRCSRNE
jgi:hypothetical protein